MMLPRMVVLSVDGETGGDDGDSSMSAACAPRLWSFGSAGLGVGLDGLLRTKHKV